jgi:hypothetical protein
LIMPWRDWEFWIVTLLACWGLWILARPFVPRKKSEGESPACPNCASGAARATPRRVALTIEKKRI